MTIATPNWPRLLFEGLKVIYGDSYKEHAPQYPVLFDQDTSSKAFEELIGSTGFRQASVITEGAAVSYQDDSQAFLSRFVHLTFGTGFIITRNMVEDDLYGSIGKRRAKKLAFVMNQTLETYHANIYNRAFNSAYPGGDEKELIATDHPNFAGGTWSNELSVASNLSEAAVEQICIDIMRWEDDAGNLINVMPKSLIIPPNEYYNAQRLFESPYRPGTADNDINVLKGKFPGGVHVNNYLSSTTAWFIRTDVPDGMISFTRRAQEQTQDNEFDTENMKFKVTWRGSAGWGDPKALAGSPGV
jgi:hypothetical protein